MILYLNNPLSVAQKYFFKLGEEVSSQNQRINLPKILTSKQCLQNIMHFQLQGSHTFEKGFI